MKYVSSSFSILLSSLNSLVLGLSFTSFNFIDTKSSSLFSSSSIFSYKFLSSLAVSNIFLGGLLFFIFNNIRNEKRLIILSTLCTLIGYLFILIYPSVYCILFSRIIIGLGCGCTCYVVPQYIFKLASEDSKGLWCSLHPINLNLGILLGQSLVYFNTVSMYYIPYISICLFLMILCFLQIFLVDIPTQDGEVSLRNLFTNKRSFKSILVVTLLHISQHFSGIDYISIYLPNILNNEYIKILLVYSITIPSVILSSLLLNKYGRKYLYLISALICCLGSVILVKYKYTGVILFLVGYNVGLSNVPWVVPNEASPPEFVAPITKLIIMSNWASAYFILILMKYVHMKYNDLGFYLYSILMGFMVIFTILFVPETKNNKEFL
ncbi:solute carrier family 2 [Vairimorpha necatrix]|uniref:Solute carrier family 2 n=1 Tax=Vairimorpha necatrix TaxID=6039 RepID=A0AAX4JEV9_9MICR